MTLYPGTCLVEGTNLSEGRGTTRPFELIGAPWIDPFRMARELAARGLPGVAFRPTWFTPTFSKHQSVCCGGVQIHVLDRAMLRPVALGIHLLHALRSHGPVDFAWREAANGTCFVDRLLGSDQPRRQLDAGAPAEDVLLSWDTQATSFEERTQVHRLYE